MHKDWFIFKTNHHIGPFCEEELFRMYYDGKISDTTLVWKEGIIEWKELRDISEIYSIISIDDIPLEDVKKEKDSNDLASVDSIQKEFLDEPLEDDGPPPILNLRIIKELPEEEAENNNVDDFKEVEDEVDEAEANDLLIEVIEEKISKKTLKPPKNYLKGKLTIFSLLRKINYNFQEKAWAKQIIATFVVLVFIMTTWVIMEETPKQINFHGLKQDEYSKLVDTMSSKKGMKINMALSVDKNSIWLASNKEFDAQLYITLKSINGRILSQKQIIATSVAKLKNHVARFNELKLLRGSRFVPGYYDVQIYGYELSKRSKIKNYLATVPFLSDWFKKTPINFKIKKSIFLHTWSPSKFEKILESYQSKVRGQKTRPLVDLQESYKTLLGLLEGLNEYVSDAINKFKYSKSFEKEFHAVYAENVSELFRAMIMSYSHWANSEEKKAEIYKNFLNNGKEFGGIVSDLIVDVRKKKRLGKTRKEKIYNDFSLKVESLKKVFKEEVQNLETKIHKID